MGGCRSFHRWARAAPRSAVAELGVVRRLTHNMFRPPPKEITEDERDLEFEAIRAPSISEAIDPDAEPFYTFIARAISPSDYVLKLTNLETGAVYFQRFSYGVMPEAPDDKPRWWPTGNEHSDAGQAIHAAELDLDVHTVYRVLVSPIPRDTA